jgi:hypothetical protein
VYQSITDPNNGPANKAQWAKKEDCWTTVKKDLDITIDNDASYLIGKDIVDFEKAEQKKDRKFVDKVEKWKFVLDKSNAGIWSPLLERYTNELEYSPKKLDILKKFATGLLPMPTESQAEIIYDIYEELIDLGWIVPK